jgi:hypothetical protein
MLHGWYLLVSTEIEKFQKGEGKEEEKYIDVVINKNMKLGQKVLIPVKQFPKVRRELCAAATEPTSRAHPGITGPGLHTLEAN